MELAHVLHDQGLLKGIEVRDIPVSDARASREMLLFGSSVKVAPVIQWDAQVIGDGRPGPVAKALLRLLEEDMRSSDRLIAVPYSSGTSGIPQECCPPCARSRCSDASGVEDTQQRFFHIMATLRNFSGGTRHGVIASEHPACSLEGSMAAPRVLWVIPALFLLAQPLDVAAQGRGNKAKAAKGGGPAFCRSGAGHPVFGREWCRQRGWDATYRSTNRAISRDNERYGNGQQTNRFPWPF